MSNIRDQHSEPRPGVTADSIFTKVFLSGDHGVATNNEYGLNSTEAFDAFVKLQRGVASLGLSEREQAAVEKDMQGLDLAVRGSPPDAAASGLHLKAVVDKLEMAGVFVSKIAALAEPARKIVEVLQLPLHLLGL